MLTPYEANILAEITGQNFNEPPAFNPRQMLPSIVFDAALPVLCYNFPDPCQILDVDLACGGRGLPSVPYCVGLRENAAGGCPRDNRAVIHRGWHCSVADLWQRLLCADQGLLPDRNLRIHLLRFAARDGGTIVGRIPGSARR
jgi:hypothetical protein